MAKAKIVESALAGFTDASGNPLASGKLYTFEVGSIAGKSLYTDKDATSAATNPVILNANGSAHVYAKGSYKFVVKTATDAIISTLDNLFFTADVQTWTPTYGASGAMTAVIGTLYQAYYVVDGGECFFSLAALLTLGGVASTDVYFSLPVSSNNTNTPFNGSRADLGGASVAYLRSTTEGIVQRYDLGNWNLGAGRYLFVSGRYKVA